jgi:hypothetical protein
MCFASLFGQSLPIGRAGASELRSCTFVRLSGLLGSTVRGILCLLRFPCSSRLLSGCELRKVLKSSEETASCHP